MNPRDYFPLGRAHDQAFCNRQTETTWLVNNIHANKHSLLVAPRRFGKSSLAERAVEKSNLPIVHINFNTCSDENDIEILIRQGVSQLIGRTFGSTEKVIYSIKNYVKYLAPRIVFGPSFAHLELISNQAVSNPAMNVEDALVLMEKLLKEKKKSAVLLFDEFQMVGLIAKGRGIEAAIRNTAQDMKHLSIIFSGSSRTLLQAMFEDENRPLYKLCRRLYLKRIDNTHYRVHLNQAAQLAWKKDLSEDVFECIMQLSERHPYYVNYLCDVLWTECVKSPKKEDVDRAWQIVIEEERSDANVEITSLSMGQKKILRVIANSSGYHLTSSSITQKTGMALSSIVGALTKLVEKDVLTKEQDHYEIINPIIKYFLKDEVALS